MLRFNADKAIDELIKLSHEAVKSLSKAVVSDIKREMRWREAISQKKFDTIISKTQELVMADIGANAYVIADTFGTGSEALTDNPKWQEYMSNKGSDEWQSNPARKGTSIVGRPKGKYIDFFGRARYSSGAFAGKNLENKRIAYKINKAKWNAKKKYYVIKPIKPSEAVITAMYWYEKSRLPNALKSIGEKMQIVLIECLEEY